MENQTVKCVKCQKPISVTEGKKTDKGYLCQNCTKKAKKKRMYIGGASILVLVIGGAIYWMSQRPEKVEEYAGVQNIQEDVNIEIVAKPFDIANTAAYNADVNSNPIDNIESFRQALQKSKSIAEEQYNASIKESEREAVKLYIPKIANHFAFNSSDISLETVSLLKEFVSVYNQTDKTASILVEGFACNIGEDYANDRISLDRANAVKGCLIKLGIPNEKIHVESYGKRRNAEFSLSSITEYRRVLVSIQ